MWEHRLLNYLKKTRNNMNLQVNSGFIARSIETIMHY